METSRREWLGAMAVGLLGTRVSVQPKDRATIVLVHGAWHGGWCWRKTLPLLRERGADVFAPSLTGLGDRKHLLTQSVGLHTHVDDISMLLEMEDLTNVVLVGHSYGGMVIAGVAAQQKARLRHLMFVDAFVPEPGRSVLDAMAGAPFRELAAKSGDGWKIPTSAATPAMLGLREAPDVAWVQAHLTDQPLKSFTDPSSITADTFKGLACSYIQTSGTALFTQLSESSKTRGWSTRQITGAGHDVMVTRPRDLVETIYALLA